MIGVERTDYLSVGTRDLERARRFYGDTFDTGVCHMAPFKDPDGNELTLHSRYAPYSDGSRP